MHSIKVYPDGNGSSYIEMDGRLLTNVLGVKIELGPGRSKKIILELHCDTVEFLDDALVKDIELRDVTRLNDSVRRFKAVLTNG